MAAPTRRHQPPTATTDRRKCRRSCRQEGRWPFVLLGMFSLFAGCAVFWGAAIAALMLGWGYGAVGMVAALALIIGGLAAFGEAWS